MKPDLRRKYLRSLVLGLLIISSFQFAFGQCPVSPAVTQTYPANNPGVVASGQVLLIPSGETYTGGSVQVDDGGVIYVATGATFSKTLGSFKGKIINCGTATFTNIDFGGANASIENYGTANVNAMNMNSANNWFNGVKAKLNFTFSIILNNSTIVNNGSIKVAGGITTNGSNVTVTNHDSLTTTGDISLNGKIFNDGYLFALGSSITLNANGNMTNGCYFLSQGNFQYNGNSLDTLTVTGLIWAKNANFAVNGSGRLKLDVGGYIQGTNFLNDGSITGTGNLFFTGETKNQGAFGTGGNAARHLNFYDSSPTGSQIMDQMNTALHSSVTKTSLPLVDNSTFIPTTCSNLIKDAACNLAINKPAAGSDVSVYGEVADLVDANTTNAQVWSFISGPVTATINSSGLATTMSTSGVYYFKLSNTTPNACTDTVIVTVANNSPVAPDCPKLAIKQEFISSDFSNPAPVISGPTITTGPNTGSRPGGSALYPNIGTVNTGNANVALDMKVTFLSTSNPSDPDGFLQFSTGAGGAANDARWRTWEWPGGTIQTILVEFFQSGTSIPATYSGVWNFSDISTGEGVYIPINVLGNYLLSPAGSTTINVSTVGTDYLFQGSVGTPGPTDPNMAFSAVIENVPSFIMKLRNGGSNTSFFVNGSNFNYIPSAACTKSDQYTTDEDNVVTVAAPGLLVNDTDKDGDALSVSQVQGGASPTTSYLGVPITVAANGSFTYDPRVVLNYLITGQTVIDSFYYQITDGHGGYDLGTVTVIVTGITDPPINTLTVLGQTICSTADSATVRILNAEAGVRYDVYRGPGSVFLKSKSGPKDTLKITIPRSGFLTGDNIITVKAVRGAVIVDLLDTTLIRVNINPTLTLAVVGDTICSNATSDPTVRISGAQAGVTYEAHLGSAGGALLGSATPSASGAINITINRALLALAPSNNAIFFTATIRGCGTQTLNNQANLRVNPNPPINLIVVGDTICSNAGTDPTVRILAAQAGVSYEAHLGSATGVLLGSTTPISSGNITITVNRALLAIGNNTLFFTAIINGCGTQSLNNQANLRVNLLPSIGSSVSANPDTVCAGGSSVITITNSTPGATYTIFDSNNPSGPIGSVAGTGGTITDSVNLNIVGLSTITVEASIIGCATVTLTQKPTIKVNKGSDVGLDVNATTQICLGDAATVTVLLSQTGVNYQVFEGSAPRSGIVTGNGATITFSITGLAVGSHTIRVRANTTGCGAVDLIEKPVVVVNDKPLATLAVRGDTLCTTSTADSLVTIINAQVGVTYRAFVGAIPVGQGLGAGLNLRFAIDRTKLSVGNNLISFTATIGGCPSVPLTATANMRVNPPPPIGLTVKGDTICSNATTNPFVTITGAVDQVTYEAYLGAEFLGIGAGPAALLQFPVDRTKLSVGNNTVRFIAIINGCGTFDMTNIANVRVNTPPVTTLVLIGDTICTSGGLAPRVIVKASEDAVTYTAFKGIDQLGTGIGTGSDLNVAIDRTKLAPGNNTVRFTVSINGCAPGNLSNTTNVRINTLPDDKLTVKGSTVCTNSPNATLTVEGTLSGVTYQAFEGTVAKGLPVVSTGTSVTLTINLGSGNANLNPAVLNHILRVESFIKGCDIVPIADTALIKINQLPDSNLVVSGGVSCGGISDPTITIAGTKAGEIYQAYNQANNIPVGPATLSPGGLLTINIPALNLGIGAHIIRVTSAIAGCAIVNLKDTAKVIVNELPSGTLTATGSIVCSNSPNATVTIQGTKSGENYQAFVGVDSVGISVTSTGNTTILLLPVSKLGVGSHIVNVRSKLAGCGVVTLLDTGLVVVNKLPDSTLIVKGSVVCNNSVTARVTIEKTNAGEIYQVYEDLVAKGNPVTSTGGTVEIDIPLGNLPDQLNRSVFDHILRVESSIKGCVTIAVKDTGLVRINPLPDSNLVVTGSVSCNNSPVASVTINGTKPGISYQVFENSNPLGNPLVSLAGGSITINIPIGTGASMLDKNIRDHIVRVQAIINGCLTVSLKDTALIRINPLPDSTLTVTGYTGCGGSSDAEVKVTGTRQGEIYQAYKGTVKLGSPVLSTGGTISIFIPIIELGEGASIINVSAKIPGCDTVNLKDTALVVLNKDFVSNLDVVGDTVCSSDENAYITILNTKAGETYKTLLGNKVIRNDTTTTGGDFRIRIPVDSLVPGVMNTIRLQSVIPGCGVSTLANAGMVLVNTRPDVELELIGDTVCNNDIQARVTILNTKANETYIAYLSLVPLDTILSNGNNITLTLPVNKLKEGPNTINATVSIPGCELQDLNKSTIVIVNPLPSDTLKVIGDTVCVGAGSVNVTVKGTKKGERYQAFEGLILIGNEITSAGGDLLLPLPVGAPSGLAAGFHKITVTSTIDGCAIVNLKDTADVWINIAVSPDLELLGDVVCSNSDSATVQVLGTKITERYTAFINTVRVSDSVLSAGGTVRLRIPVTALQPDTNIIRVQTSIPGCGSIFLIRSALVVLNPLPSGEVLTEGDTVCQTAGIAVLSVFGTQKKVSYQAYLLDGTAIGSAVVSTVSGSRVELTIPVSGLLSVENKLTVRAKIEACSEVRIKDTALIVVNRLPLTTRVNIDGSSMCPGEDGEVTMSGGDKDITYTVFVNGQSTPFTFRGQSPATKLIIPASYLPKDVNSVSLTATIPACSPVEAGDGTSIYVLYKHLNIMGDTLLCDSSESEYMVVPLAGALSYKWTVDQDAQIVSPFDTASSVKVKFGTQTAVVKVVPVATNTTCEISGDTMRVKIEPPVRGTGIIESKDTACLHELDSVYVSGLTGVSSYNWIWPGTDSLYRYGPTKRTKRDSVSYEEAGFVNLKVLAYSNCAGNYVDTLAKKVRVLSIPTAEANEYENLEPMRGNFRSVPLNGLGSSETSGMDTISYKWYVGNPNFGTITNPGSLMDASILPAFNVTKVYLLVTNINGYCPVKDSAVINLNYTVEIPNVFTPNGDGVHDSWDIKNINMFFPNCTVEVFNKWGSFVYSSANGYPEPWNGTRNGEDMPVATYYYIVDFKNGETPRKGSLTIIR